VEEGVIREERWNLWMLYCCSNYANHPEGAPVGVAILTNYYYRPLVLSEMARRICTTCGGEMVFAGQESALTLFLQHDIERLKGYGYYIMKDEELMWQFE
jgi:hypothetical protein